FIVSGGSLPIFILIHFCKPVVSRFNESNFLAVKKEFIIKYNSHLTDNFKEKSLLLLPYVLILCIRLIVCLISSEINASGTTRLFLNFILRSSKTEVGSEISTKLLLVSDATDIG